MAVATRSLKVFLCNADQDQDTVLGFYRRLKIDNVDAWLAEEELVGGENRELEIRKAVKDADVVLVFLSSHFNRAGDHLKEVRIALDAAQNLREGQIFIVPVRLEPCEVPENLRTWHYVDLFDQDGYEKLTRALRKRAKDIGITLQLKKSQIQDSLSEKKNATKVNFGTVDSKQPSLQKEKKDTRHSSRIGLNTAIVVALIGCIGTIIAALLGSPILANLFSSNTPVPTANVTAIIEPTFTPVTNDTPLPAEISTLPVSSDPFIGKDGMKLIEIPAGEFEMGRAGSDADERPVRMVYVDAFLIDQTEVTNAMYALCVEEHRCDPPEANTSITHNEQTKEIYYGNPEFDNYPVVYVAWSDAKAYCKWAGRRLPTEAEWEKSASWDDAQKVKRTYPWGNRVDCSFANYYGNGSNLCVGDTTPVGSYPGGASYYGVLDMAGNVWEWVADRYEAAFYKDSSSNNPLSNSGLKVVVRGGSFLTGRAVGIRSSDRESLPPENSSHNLGFRCAMDSP